MSVGLEVLIGLVGVGVTTLAMIGGLLVFQEWGERDRDREPS